MSAMSSPPPPPPPPAASAVGARASTPINSEAGLILTEDDIAIEGMVLALLRELEERGYTLPPGLPTLPADMPLDEAEAECAFLRTVFGVQRHRAVLDRYLPTLHQQRAGAANGRLDGGGAGVSSGSILSTNHAPTRPSALPAPPPSSSELSSSAPSRPSPLSSQLIDTTVLTSPSALFLSSLLSLLISLQTEPRGIVQETDRGVDGELRMFKARRELGERLYAVVEGLLDSYLLTGDQRDDEDETEDALVTLLFHDFPLNYDSMDRATCSMDLLLNLSSFPFVEAEDLISHPVVLATTEYVWRNGLLPPPKKGEGRPPTWKEAFVRLDRFSIPRILHSQSYILSTLHAAITIYILMFSAYSHFDALNPLAPNAPRDPGGLERGRPAKTWSFGTEAVWWLWVAGTFGWAGENSPAFGAPTHQQWQKIRDGRRRRDVGYRPPPKKVPVSHRALRSLEANLGGLVQFATYFAVFGVLLLWSLSGEVDYPGVLLQLVHLPLAFLPSPVSSALDPAALSSSRQRPASPIEARTTLAFTLVLGAVLAYFSGGRPSISPKQSHPNPVHALTPRRELDDLDGWDRYGREVAFRARRERLAINRYFSFVPPRGVVEPYSPVSASSPRPRVGQRRLESLASAFSTPPLPSPLNLAVPAIELAGAVVRRLGRDEQAARRVQEVARLWVWRVGISPLGGWAVAAKGYRKLRGRE
ncbi:SPOSA6832_05003 [Sporobolomyces salmonicolor]|uniref:SPOSA6832_05003-mRNA-1:cds n=1 Tax=Sporidiobolus salmonicolor TaxID=5005 RepID=A0A0D6EU14_SPOSA|nr:SPOSA6832_05003 [Sporobolomyces salmonicolor]